MTTTKTKKKRKKPTRTAVSPETFVKVWQQSSSIDEVCKTTGMPKNTAYGRVTSYRRKGISLKSMRRPHKKLDIVALNKLSTESLKK